MARPVKVGAAYDEQSVKNLIVSMRRTLASERPDAERRRIALAYLDLIRWHGCTERIPLTAPSGRHPGQGADFLAKDRVELGKIIKRAEKDTTRPAAINRKIRDKAEWLVSVLDRESYAGSSDGASAAASAPSIASSSAA